MDEALASLLDGYTLYASDDIAKSDLELVHDICETVLCDAEATDTLSTLVSVAMNHERECAG
ncbi:hypothetical protein PBI_TEAMOCIL_12 [Microbacterium phage Teamocil]|uniref:Uncharacterized protein n=1 Tax=Microbacterium phage Teamocil TaxID=2656554 RepID=A0A649VXL9_9CAUD|nr:hypothetical protein QDA12_gp12 [Microbacterium phage Teamocil]QGJ88867.1 hypothetical protein PBI_GINA_12 [Microbacterium phage Gina]QGJ96964.1 hypothetical protein PBI_TEAMOCIL_12 [Microbacterium phage Teamocil]